MGALLTRMVFGTGLAVAVLGTGAGRAGAQPTPAAPAQDAAAKRAEAEKLVSAGIAAQENKDYDKAVELFTKAFDLVPHPILLFNIGQAHRLAGRNDQAVVFYKRYLELDPNGPESATARTLLTELPEPAPAPAPAAPTAAAAPTASLAASREGSVDAVARPGRGLRITGIALGGVGLALAATSTYVGITMKQLESDELDRLNAGEPFDNEANDRGERYEVIHKVTLALAGGFLVGGVVTYWLGHKKGQAAPTTAWVPTVGADYAGIAYTGLWR